MRRPGRLSPFALDLGSTPADFFLHIVITAVVVFVRFRVVPLLYLSQLGAIVLSCLEQLV
jgi:hypothetical protein